MCSMTRDSIRGPRKLAGIALLLVLCACRDMVMPAPNERFGDVDVLAGRTSEFADAPGGRQTLTAAEAERGWFMSRSEYLEPLAQLVRDRVGGRFDAFGSLETNTEGWVLIFRPLQGPRGSLVQESVMRDESFAQMPVSALRAEYGALCTDPFLGQIFPPLAGSCDPIPMQGVSDVFEELRMSPRSDGISFAWRAPIPGVDIDATAPVLAVTVPLSISMNQTEATGAWIDVDLSRATFEYGVQPILCNPTPQSSSLPPCRDDAVPFFEGYRRGVDARFPVLGAELNVVGRLISHNGDADCTVLGLIVGNIFCAIAAGFGGESIDGALRNAAVSTGELIDLIMSAPSLVSGGVDFSSALVDINGGPGFPALDDEPIGSTGGVWTDSTVLALARGGTLTGPAGISINIPASPTVAVIIDAIGNFALEMRRVFAGPLVELSLRERTTVYLTSATAPTDPLPGGGPPPTVGRFTFLRDRDRDGIGEPDDLCADVADPDQAESDGDRWGDACDRCQGIANDGNYDRDRDGAGSECDCDRDGDGCLNEGVGPDGQPCPAPSGGASLDVTPDQAHFSDGDGDDIPDDCDSDRDGDGVDDGQDNCVDDPNADQANWNASVNGLGDACDILCPQRNRLPFCIFLGYADDPHLPPQVPGSYPVPFPGPVPGPLCVAGPEGCLLSPVWDEIEIDPRELRDPSPRVLNLVDRTGRMALQLRARDLEVRSDLGSALAVLPDLDGDGVEELAIAAPAERSCRKRRWFGSSCGPSEGTVMIVSVFDGRVLWRLRAPQGVSGLGTSLLASDGRLWVGAPAARNEGGSATGAVVTYGLYPEPHVERVLWGTERDGRFGASLAHAPDVDGDGGADILVGAPGEAPRHLPGAGRLYLVSRTGRGTIFEGGSAGLAVGAGQGRTVATDAGVFVGVPLANKGAGGVTFYGWDGKPVWSLAGDPDEHLGAALAVIPGDGDSLLAVGAPDASKGVGRVVVVDPRTGRPRHTVVLGWGSRAGMSLAVIPDADPAGAGRMAIGVLSPGKAGRKGRGVSIVWPRASWPAAAG
jgi:hypothetical protein